MQAMARIAKHYRSRFTTVVGFQPTGWSHAQSRGKASHGRRRQKGTLITYQVPSYALMHFCTVDFKCQTGCFSGLCMAAIATLRLHLPSICGRYLSVSMHDGCVPYFLL